MDNILSALERNAARADKAHLFLRSDGTESRLSFAGLWMRSLQAAAGLRELGAKPGDRVALALQEPDAFVPTFLASLIAGVVPVPLAPAVAGRSTFFDRTRHVLERARARMLVTDATTSAAVRLKLRAAATEPLRVIDEPELGSAGDGARPSVASAPPDALAFLQFTSGSTNRPKGVMVTHGNLSANARVILAGMGIHENDRGACWLPLFHDMGLLGFVIAPVFGQARVVYSSTLRFGRKPTRWFDDIHEYRLTATLAPNFALGLLTQLASDEQIARWDLSSLRVIGCGAEPIHADTVARFQSRFAACGLRSHVVLPSYGLAESTLAVTFAKAANPIKLDHRPAGVAAAESAPASVVSCGRPLGCEVDIVDVLGRRLPEGRVGEVVVRGPSVSPGYFDDPDATAEVFGSSGLKTGDLGYLREGELFICGRLRELIILRGRNYYPTDLEQTLRAREPRLLGCAALGLEIGGERQLAIVAEVPGGLPEPARVIDSIRRALWDDCELDAAAVVLVAPAQIPRTTSGKLQRGACGTALLQGRLEVIAAHSRVPLGAIPASELPSIARDTAPAIAARAIDELGARTLLASQLAELLGVDESAIDLQRPFADFGLDSVKALRWIQQLSEALGRVLEPELLWRFPSVVELARFLAPEPRPERAPQPMAAGAPAPTAPTPAADPPLGELSEVELAALLERELASLRAEVAS